MGSSDINLQVKVISGKTVTLYASADATSAIKGSITSGIFTASKKVSDIYGFTYYYLAEKGAWAQTSFFESSGDDKDSSSSSSGAIKLKVKVISGKTATLYASPDATSTIKGSVSRSNGTFTATQKISDIYGFTYYYLSEEGAWAQASFFESVNANSVNVESISSSGLTAGVSSILSSTLEFNNNKPTASVGNYFNNVLGFNNNPHVYAGANAATYQHFEEATKTFDTRVEEYLEKQTLLDTSNLATKNLDGIMGVPYQFMNTVDPRISDSIYGRTYADRIVSRMPLLLISPGKVAFRTTDDKADRESDLISLITAGESLVSGLTSIGGDEKKHVLTRYYDFAFNWAEYYEYVNMMMATGAAFLGIRDVKIRCGEKDKRIEDIDWSKMGQNEFKSIYSSKEYVAFYIDSADTVSESFSNQTTESTLANKMNSISDSAKEIEFITGMTGVGASYFDEDKEKETLESITSTVDKFTKEGKMANELLTAITGNFSTVALGGKLIFPEIWQDSDFSRDYDVNIKLRTPDKDPISWYLNIYRPLAHLVCLTAPQQSENVNGYKSPFLVRAFYKGLINCDMGIISSLNISKGKESAWTLDGLPTEVDVSMTIKDMYNNLTITKEKDAANFINNISLVSYIANSCGVNINSDDVDRMTDIYVMLKTNKYQHIASNTWNKVQQNFTNRAGTLGRKIKEILR